MQHAEQLRCCRSEHTVYALQIENVADGNATFCLHARLAAGLSSRRLADVCGFMRSNTGQLLHTSCIM